MADLPYNQAALPTKEEDGSGNPLTSSLLPSGKQALDVNLHVSDSGATDGFGRIRVSDTDLVESLHFSNTNHPLLVNTAVTGSATTAYNSSTSSLRLTCTTGSSDTAIAQTKRYFRYNPGRSYLVTLSGNFGAKKANTTWRAGYFDANNGLFFYQDSTNLAVVTRTNSSGSPVDTQVNQSSWNIDKLDGTGPSGVTLDPSKHNLYVIDFLWHGAGRVRYGIFYNGRIIYCHQINNANINTLPFMRVPSLPLRVELNNTAGTVSTTTLDLVCFAYQKEASDALTAPYTFTASRGTTSVSVAGTLIPLMSIRPKATFNSVTNRVPIVANSASIMTNQQSIYVAIYLNPTLTGASFNSAGTNSAVEFDTAATALSGGTLLREIYIPGSSSLTASVSAAVSADLELVSLGLDIAGSVQDTLTIAAKSTAGGSATWAQMDWQEFQ